METAERLQRRIRTAEELHSVVRAMKALASVSIRQHERAAAALGHYVHTIDLGFRILARNEPGLLREVPRDDGTRTGLVVFGSDQGLCGPFNRSIADHAEAWLRERPGIRDGLLVACVGARAAVELDARGIHPTVVRRTPGSVAAIGRDVHELLVLVDGWHREEEVGHVVLLHHRSGEDRTHHPSATRLLPPDMARERALAEHPWPTRMLPMSMHPPAELLAALTRETTFAVLHRAYLESLASEHAARLAAMQGAERTIEERLEELTRAHHQLRQATITDELLDVSAGFEALGSEADGSAGSLPAG